MKSCLASFLLLAACSSGPGHTGDDAPDPDPDASVPLPDAEVDYPPASGVDLLFVIDDSGTMAEEQDALASAFLDQFLADLEAAHGGRPDLHIGVISTNMGAGGYTFSGCGGAGDDGTLLTGRQKGQCGLDRPYIVDGSTTNYPTTLGDAFTCISDLGALGCGFEQPLASLERAFTNPLNGGFFRDDAALAIVFLGDEDDCSASDPMTLFDPSDKSPDGPLGPVTSFRCFEFGVVCDPDDPRPEGAKSGCVPRTDSPTMIDPAAVADAVKARKSPGHVAVAVITGDAAPVVVTRAEFDPVAPLLAPSCESATGLAYPGIRLHAFADEFGARHTAGSICNPYTEPLGDFADVIATMLE